MRFVVSLVALAVLCACTEARLGVDASQLYPQTSWDCLVKNGYTFAIIRCYRSSDSVDPNCAETVKRAWAAGMNHVDLYMFPCAKCSDIESQVKRLDDHIKQNNIRYGQVWIDIEGYDRYWNKDKMKNREIFNKLVTAANATFLDHLGGLYVSRHSWNDILGSDYKEWGNLNVWYANWDHKAGMGNWQPYGNFTHPTMHQYWGDYHQICKINVDLNYRD